MILFLRHVNLYPIRTKKSYGEIKSLNFKLKKYKDRKAISPVVATLILIIIAIVGAVAVGLIMSGIATQTGKQSSVGNVQSQAQNTLYIGGSTTVYPVVAAAAPAFTAQTGLQIVLAQGGSDAGMQGVITGAYDIGMASSAAAVNNAYNYVQSNNLVGVTINPVLIGGSGIVVIENGPGATGTPGFIVDAATTPNACLGITRSALQAIFELGQFGIIGSACAAGGTTWNTLQEVTSGTSTTICAFAATTFPPTEPQLAGVTFPACAGGTTDTGAVYAAVSRSDNSGTEDQFTSYLGLPHQSAGGVPGGNGGLAGEQALGNPGVLAGVQSCKYVQNGIASKGCVGFVDLGFAEGAPANANHVAGWSSGLSDGVALPQVTTNNPGQAPIDAATSSLPQQFTESSGTVTTYDGYVPSLQTTGNVHAAIVAALKSASLVNPLTLQGSSQVFPDNGGSFSTGLARTFYLVTNGAPTPNEEKFILFLTSFNAETYFSQNGYFSQYDFAGA
jgi:flagellin-like protein